MKNIDKYRIKNKLNKNNKKGFTLIELVVVIAVIAILSGVSVGAYFGIQKEAKEKALLAEATDSYNQYRIDQILNNEELNDSSKIDGVYYSENYDEYILFKDDTTYNLGKYIEETNEFTNTNRFALDYDNDGLPVVIDLDNSVEGIESSEELINEYYYCTLYDGILYNYRTTSLDRVSVYNLFDKSHTLGNINNYNCLFYFELNSEDRIETSFNDKETYSLSPKFILDEEVYNENVMGKQLLTYSDKIKEKNNNINNPNFLINPYYMIDEENWETELVLPESFNNVPVTNVEKLYAFDERSLMRDVTTLIIPKTYYTFSEDDSLTSQWVWNQYDYSGRFFYSSLKNLYFTNSDLYFNNNFYIPSNYNPDANIYEINLFLNSMQSTAYRTFSNIDGIELTKMVNNQTKIRKGDLDIGYLKIDGLFISDGKLEEILKIDELDYVNIFDSYITDLDANKEEIIFPVSNIPTNKTLFAPTASYKKELEYSNKTLDIDETDISEILIKNKKKTIKIQDDFTLDGTLIIGGVINKANVGIQGLITSDYNVLDLNGHNIYINDGGSLKSYGYITDSVGGGKIIVNDGGSLITPFVVTDYEGGTTTAGKYNSNMSPFNSYMMPYIDVTTELKYGSKLIGNCVLYAGGEHNSTEISFIGSDNTSMIQILDQESSIKLAKEGELNDLSSYYEKIEFNGNFNINPMELDIGTTIESSKVPFPISQYLHLIINEGTTISVNQLLKVMYGAKIEAFDSSKIIFNDVENENSIQSGLYIYNKFNSTSIEYPPRDINHASGNIFGLSYYKQVERGSSIKIDSNIEFKGKNHIFSGKFDSLKAFDTYIKNNIGNLRISLNAIYEGGVYKNNSNGWIFGNAFIYCGGSAANYQSTPLIIGEKAYIQSPDNPNVLIEGKYDQNNHIFTSNNETYGFILTNSFKAGSYMFQDNSEIVFNDNTKGNYQKLTLKEKGVYEYNGEEYVYYLGIFVKGSYSNDKFTFHNNNFAYFMYDFDNSYPLVINEEITLTYKDGKWNQ